LRGKKEGIFTVVNSARFNGSSYVSMIEDDIEKLISPIYYWKFIKIRTAACPFLELTERIKPVLYDGNKLNSVFPFNCDTLPLSGDFSVVILAENMNQIFNLDESLNEMGIKTCNLWVDKNVPEMCQEFLK
jgi:hypothetical protein